MKRRVRASEKTRKRLEELVASQASEENGRSDLVKLATRLIEEEVLESEIRTFTDSHGECLQSKSAISTLSEQLWGDY